MFTSCFGTPTSSEDWVPTSPHDFEPKTLKKQNGFGSCIWVPTIIRMLHFHGMKPAFVVLRFLSAIARVASLVHDVLGKFGEPVNIAMVHAVQPAEGVILDDRVHLVRKLSVQRVGGRG